MCSCVDVLSFSSQKFLVASKMTRTKHLTPWSLSSSVVVGVVSSLLLLWGGASGKYLTDDRFMSDINLEHYYILEESVLSHADILLRDNYFGAEEEEAAEEHLEHAPNLTDVHSIIDETKAIHRLAGPDLPAFLSHPINIFHLFRRLDTHWREGLNLLLQTSPCKKWRLPSMLSHLEYLRQNLPGREEVERVIYHTALIQRIHGLRAVDIAEGKIGDHKAIKPLTIEEQFEFVKVLREQDDMYTALMWLAQVRDWLLKSPDVDNTLGFNLTDTLNLMASAQYYLKNVSGALELTEQVLKLDPNNGVAQTNKGFFKGKLSNQEANGVDAPQQSRPPKASRYERLCTRRSRSKVSKKRCRMVRVGLTFYKMEVIRSKPLVVLFHDVLGPASTDAIKIFTHQQLTERAWYREETFRPPELSLVLNPSKIKSLRVRYATKRVLRHVVQLDQAINFSPQQKGSLRVMNVGIEGAHLSQYGEKLGLFKDLKGDTGAYVVFLNDVKAGGDVVLTSAGVSVKPKRGSVLFYMVSRTDSHSHCPVLGTSLWAAIQPVYKTSRDYCVDEDEWNY